MKQQDLYVLIIILLIFFYWNSKTIENFATTYLKKPITTTSEYNSDIRYYASYISDLISSIYLDERAHLFNNSTGFGTASMWTPTTNLDPILLSDENYLKRNARQQIKTFIDSAQVVIQNKYSPETVKNASYALDYSVYPNNVLKVRYRENNKDTFYIV